MTEWRSHHDNTQIMQFLCDGIDLDPISFESDRIIPVLYRDRVFARLPVCQIVKKQCRLMGEYSLSTAQMQNIHSIHPYIRGNIDPMRGLLNVIFLDIGI